MNILFIGDMHLDSRTPISRKDDYRQTVLTKLKSVLKYAKENEVKKIFTTGDTFNRTEQSLLFLNDLMDVLNLYKKEGIEVYSLVGNHDLPYNSFEYFKNTPLSLIFKSGGMIRIPNDKPISIDSKTDLYGISFTESVPKVLDKEKTNILIMHYATDNTIPNESIRREDLGNFKIVVAGHDHNYYGVAQELPLVLRPGSFTRLTKEKYNLERNILMYKIDTQTLEVKEVELEGILHAEDVFKSVVFTKGTSFAEELDFSNIFKENYFKKEVSDIYSIVESLPVSITKESKETIKTYLEKVIPKE